MPASERKSQAKSLVDVSQPCAKLTTVRNKAVGWDKASTGQLQSLWLPILSESTEVILACSDSGVCGHAGREVHAWLIVGKVTRDTPNKVVQLEQAVAALTVIVSKLAGALRSGRRFESRSRFIC